MDGKVLSELLIQAGELNGQPQQNHNVKLTSRIQVQNAVIEAVAHLGVRHIDMPTTPQRVWTAINEAQKASHQ